MKNETKSINSSDSAVAVTNSFLAIIAQLKPFLGVRQKLHNFSSVGAERPNAIRVANLQYHDTLSS